MRKKSGLSRRIKQTIYLTGSSVITLSHTACASRGAYQAHSGGAGEQPPAEEEGQAILRARDESGGFAQRRQRLTHGFGSGHYGRPGLRSWVGVFAAPAGGVGGADDGGEHIHPK